MTETSCLASTSTRRWLCRYVSSRVPACDVEDVVQATLLDAVASARAPDQSEDLERWLLGIARYKVVDAHRARGRTRRTEAAETAACASSVEAVAMAEWATRQLPPGPSGARTLGWMVREAEGEKLEAIADEEGLPAERVRQRVSRLRRFMREKWRAELGALALVLIAAAGLRTILWPPAEAVIVAEGDASVLLRGTWRLADFTPEAPLSTARGALLDASRPTLRITFDGARVTLVTATLERAYSVVEATAERLVLADDRGGRLEIALSRERDALVARLASGPWAGSARLVR